MSTQLPQASDAIEAAAKAMYYADEDTNAGRTWEEAIAEGVADGYRSMASVALVAAAVEASDAEKLAVALRFYVGNGDHVTQRQHDAAIVALSAYDASRRAGG